MDFLGFLPHWTTAHSLFHPPKSDDGIWCELAVGHEEKPKGFEGACRNGCQGRGDKVMAGTKTVCVPGGGRAQV